MGVKRSVRREFGISEKTLDNFSRADGGGSATSTAISDASHGLAEGTVSFSGMYVCSNIYTKLSFPKGTVKVVRRKGSVCSMTLAANRSSSSRTLEDLESKSDA